MGNSSDIWTPEREQTHLEPQNGNGGGMPPGVETKKSRGPLLKVLIVLGVIMLAAVGGVLSLYLVGRGMAHTDSSGYESDIPPLDKKIDVKKLDERIKANEKKLASLEPKGLYIVIDTALNRLYLHEGETVIREAIVSCGSGNILTNPEGGKTWIFDTPRGEYKIERKVKSPVWVKPDWAFVEEGKPIPPRNSEERFERDVMGDYALALGKGYFIHGTLYKRMLGRNVTHGCVRVGDDDLKLIHDKAPIGTKVYIF